MNDDDNTRIRDVLQAAVERPRTAPAPDAWGLVRHALNRRKRERRLRNLAVGSAFAAVIVIVVVTVGGNGTGAARRHVRVAGSSTTTVPSTTTEPATTTESTTTTTVTEKPPLGLTSTGVGDVAFDAPASDVEAVLVAALGPPASDSGWARDQCVEKQLKYLRWDALEIRLSDDGSGARFDGWALDQASGEPPAGVQVTRAISFATTWPQLQALGAVFYEDTNGWRIDSWSLYGDLSTALPSDSSTVTAFAAGTTRLLHC